LIGLIECLPMGREKGDGRWQQTGSLKECMGLGNEAIDRVWRELVGLCNEQFDAPPFKRLLKTRFTRERAQQYSIQMAYTTSRTGATAGPMFKARRRWK
jgi:hypothetical protein